jgi:hypothetical protein
VETWIFGSWMTLVLSAIIIPSVAWLVKEVLAQRKELVAMDLKITSISTDCKRHQEWQLNMQKILNRVDKNMGRVCLALRIPEVD